MNETDPKYLKDIILSFIIAGKDTTASTLSWFFYMMCKHPLVQEKIIKEVQEAANLKENSSIDDIAKSITEEALDKMQFLHAALSETLRLYPAVPAVTIDFFLRLHIDVSRGFLQHGFIYRMERCVFRMILYQMDSVSRKGT